MDKVDRRFGYAIEDRDGTLYLHDLEAAASIGLDPYGTGELFWATAEDWPLVEERLKENSLTQAKLQFLEPRTTENHAFLVENLEALLQFRREREALFPRRLDDWQWIRGAFTGFLLKHGISPQPATSSRGTALTLLPTFEGEALRDFCRYNFNLEDQCNLSSLANLWFDGELWVAGKEALPVIDRIAAYRGWVAEFDDSDDDDQGDNDGNDDGQDAGSAVSDPLTTIEAA